MNIKGVIPPIPTPFVKGRASPDKMASNVNKWNKFGLSGYLFLGSNGERELLSEPEALEMVEAVSKEKAQDMLLIAGTGMQSAKETIRYNLACYGKGAQAVLVTPPSYYKPKMNYQALRAFFTQVANNVPIPILIYHVPAYTNLTLSPELIIELAQHPKIVGIKDSSVNMGFMGEIIDSVKDDFSVLVSSGSGLLPGLVCGAQGGDNGSCQYRT